MLTGPCNDHTEAPGRHEGVVERGTPKRRQVHGILKAQGSLVEKNVGGVVWDEMTIAEHDKDRGTRMKIDEPNTPYYHLGSNEELLIDETCAPIVLPNCPIADASEDSNFEPSMNGVGGGLTPQDPRFTGMSAIDISKAKHEISKQNAKPVNATELFEKLQQCVEEGPGEAIAAFARSRSVQLSSESLQEEQKHLTPEDLAKKEEFAKRRKAHYTEFLRMQESKRSGSLDSDDEEGDEEKDEAR